MRITRFTVSNLRSIADSGPIDLGPITLFVGKNSAGKSTLLRALHSIQAGGALQGKDVRYAEKHATISFDLDDVHAGHFWNNQLPGTDAKLVKMLPADGRQLTAELTMGDGTQVGVGEIAGTSPRNLFYPFLSGRKVPTYDETVNIAASQSVGTTMSNLVGRMDPLVSPNHPLHGDFMELLTNVVGLKLTTVPSDNGKRIGLWVSKSEALFLEDMGDGIAQLLAFIVSLCTAEGQIFLVEELENDVHPEALKLLLGAIERNQSKNQFVISTHNNIVLRNLGSLPDTKIYEVLSSAAGDEVGFNIPTTTVEMVGNEPKDRIALLKHLGYELSDMDLWDGWLLLEESSGSSQSRV